MMFDRVHVWDITALAKAFVGQTNGIQALDGTNGASFFSVFLSRYSVVCTCTYFWSDTLARQ